MNTITQPQIEEKPFKIARLYNGEIEVKFNPRNHRYYINGEPAKNSVSGICGVIGKGDALINWMIRTALDEQTKRLLDALRVGQVIDDIFIAGIAQLAKSKPEEKRDEAADEGTRVHELLESWITAGLIRGGGKFEVVDRDVADLLQICAAYPDSLLLSMEQLGKFVTAHSGSFIASERMLYSRTHEYPGTLDFEIVMDGKLSIGDFKIRGGVYEETRLQTAAYQLAASEENGLKYGDRWVFRIGRKDGQFTGDFEPICFDAKSYKQDAAAFLAALKIKEWQKSVKK